MAVNQDELLAQMLDQTLAKRGGRPSPPALNAMQSWDPALNPSAPSTVERKQRGAAIMARNPNAVPAYSTPPALVQPPAQVAPVQAANSARVKPIPLVAPMTRTGRGGIPTPVVGGGGPGPRFSQGPAGSGGAGRGRTTVQTPPALIQDAQAKTTATAASQAPAKAVTAPPAATPPVSELAASGGMYRSLAGQRAQLALNSDNAGSATIQGRFLSKDGTRGPQETRAYTQGGIADAGKRVNVVPAGSLFGPSLADDQALSDARFAAAKRGDFEAVERSYMTPEQKQAARVQKAENKILSAVGGVPISQLPQAAQAVSGIGAGRQALEKGAQELQQGAMELERGQQVQSMLDELFNADPTNPESKARRDVIMEQFQAMLAASGKTPPAAAQPYKTVMGTDVDGNPVPFTTNQITGAVTRPQVGGAQSAQPTQAHLSVLQQNSEDPEAIAAFEAQYGPGSAARYLTPSG